jgi:hypothetical protein
MMTAVTTPRKGITKIEAVFHVLVSAIKGKEGYEGGEYEG